MIELIDLQNVSAAARYGSEFLHVDVTHADCENGYAISTEFSSSSFWLKSSSSLAVRHDNEHARNRRRQWAGTVLYVQHLIPN